VIGRQRVVEGALQIFAEAGPGRWPEGLCCAGAASAAAVTHSPSRGPEGRGERR